MTSNYNFEKDVQESLDIFKKHALSGGEGMGFIDHGTFLEIAYHKIKSRSWWILFVPFHTKSKVLQAIEYKYYPPKTRKNAGFELVPLFEYETIVVFCHKSCMSGEQLTKVLHKMTDVVDPSRKITEERDIIPLLEFAEKETHEWILKIEKYKNDMYLNPQNVKQFRTKNNVQGMAEYGIEVRSKNPKVIEEIKLFHKLDRLLSELHDYVIKQESEM